MTERYTYTVTVEPGDAETVAQMVERIAEDTRSSYTIGLSYVCPDCGCEWSEKRCRSCEAVKRAEGRD